MNDFCENLDENYIIKFFFACCSVEGTDIELWHSTTVVVCRADSRSASSQWKTALICNDVSHWLVVSLESALDMYILYCIISYCHCVCTTTMICMRACYVACLWNGRYSLVWFTQRGLVSPYGIVKFCHQWFRLWLRTCLAPSHYRNQCWLIANPEENVKISMKFVPWHPITWAPAILPKRPLTWNCNKCRCFCTFPLEFGGLVISTHIRTEGLYVKTTIIYQLKWLCVPDCAYTETMFINSMHISLYDISLTQNILY